MIQESMCVMFHHSCVGLSGECAETESTGVVVKNVSASWSSDKEKVAISGVSFQVDQVCTCTCTYNQYVTLYHRAVFLSVVLTPICTYLYVYISTSYLCGKN